MVFPATKRRRKRNHTQKRVSLWTNSRTNYRSDTYCRVRINLLPPLPLLLLLLLLSRLGNARTAGGGGTGGGEVLKQQSNCQVLPCRLLTSCDQLQLLLAGKPYFFPSFLLLRFTARKNCKRVIDNFESKKN